MTAIDRLRTSLLGPPEPLRIRGFADARRRNGGSTVGAPSKGLTMVVASMIKSLPVLRRAGA